MPIIFLAPTITLLSYGVMRLMGLPLSEPDIPLLAIPILLVVFFVSSAGEETGWMGYAADSMQDRWSALRTSIILGLAWGMFHVVPLIQAGNTPTWIAGWFLGTVAVRILIVWLY